VDYNIGSIIDIGFDDLCWLDQEILNKCDYIGFDVSTVAVERARETYPSLRFVGHDMTMAPVDAKGDLVVSFDLLIHQIDAPLFRLALANTLAAIGKVGLISYRTPAMPDGSFPPPEILDRATADPAALESETGFRHMVETLRPDTPTAETAFHEPLPMAVAALRDELEVAVAGRYRYQTIYAIRPPGGRPAASDGAPR
jgi:hypothetical protein